MRMRYGTITLLKQIPLTSTWSVISSYATNNPSVRLGWSYKSSSPIRTMKWTVHTMTTSERVYRSLSLSLSLLIVSVHAPVYMFYFGRPSFPATALYSTTNPLVLSIVFSSPLSLVLLLLLSLLSRSRTLPLSVYVLFCIVCPPKSTLRY